MNTSWRSEKVTHDKVSGTTCPTFKILPLYYEVQFPPHLREQMLLKCLAHWFEEPIATQNTRIVIMPAEYDTFWVEDIDKVGQRYSQEYPRTGNLHSCSRVGRCGGDRSLDALLALRRRGSAG